MSDLHPAWCAHGDESPDHTHMSKPYAKTLYVAIVQSPGQDPRIRLSTWTHSDPTLSLTAADARMLAWLSKQATAEALRKAAGELDLITSGGGQ